MFQPSIAIVEGDPAIERLVEPHGGAGEAAAPVLRWDLEATAVPLHDVVVADRAFVHERTDALEIAGSRAPGLGGMAGAVGEAAVVVDSELMQHGVGGVDVGSLSQTQFAAQTILQHAPEAFDAAFGLGRLGGDEGDAELLERAAELGGLALSGQLFLDGPVVVMTDEDAATVAIEGGGCTEAAEQALEQAEIALGGFCGEELSNKDLSGSIVLHAESGEERAATLQPVMRGAIELHQFSFAGRAQTALAMSGRAALARRADSGRPQQTAERFAAECEAFLLDKLVVQVMIVEAGVLRASQAQDGLPGAFGPAAALQFLLTQRDCLPVHGVTFSRCY